MKLWIAVLLTLMSTSSALAFEWNHGRKQSFRPCHLTLHGIRCYGTKYYCEPTYYPDFCVTTGCTDLTECVVIGGSIECNGDSDPGCELNDDWP